MSRAFAICSVAVTVLCSQSAWAQQPSAPAVAGGVKFGLNVASVSEEETDSTNGLVVGGYLRRAIDDSLAIQPEFLYSQQGGAYREETLNLNYLQIPVLAVYGFQGSSTSTLRPFVAAGPVLALRLGASISRLGRSVDLADDTPGMDFGLAFGGGVERGVLSFEGRYFVGLKDADKGNDISKNRVFSILVGFRLGGR